MAEQQLSDEYEAPEPDAAEQLLLVEERDREQEAVEGASAEPELPLEVNPADAAEQAVPVPVDDDEYR